ncbi:hypothetical protein BGX28_004504 [Mortierella sp. GBA30]|nr:hypothetical protein BGX28_004504 [Mortierella sp. GBA30]
MICDYPSKLSHIQYRGYMLAGTSLSNTLRRCPALHTVDLEDTSLISALEIDMYRHPGVKHVVIRNIGAANGAEQGRAIVRHFPNLEAVTLHSKNNRMTFPVRAIKEAKGAWNLRLKVLDIESLPESVVNDLSMHVSGESTKIALNYSAVSPIVILSMLVYRNILTDILACVSRGELYMNRDVPAVDDHFRSTGWMMQALPRHCPKLETLEIPDHEMDMDDVESVDWACKDLSELRVRIKGLDTAEKIDDALDLWKKRRLHEKASVPNINAFSTNAGLMSIVMGVDDVEAESTSIEARVARHLLRFDRLTTVWLGTSVWSV